MILGFFLLPALVSIHVPTRGTTSIASSSIAISSSFNPRSHEGNDNICFQLSDSRSGFNPRSHEGNDRGVSGFILRIHSVSIHVPTRGTTTFRRFAFSFRSCFNPRSHEGNDGGERRCGRRCLRSFNPRSHEGNDVPLIYNTSYAGVSIHVPTRGTTIIHFKFLVFSVVSIHVPTRGTTQYIKATNYNFSVSIHVPTRGTTEETAAAIGIMAFQSTFPRGERPFVDAFNLVGLSFNPRSHEGNDDYAGR